MFSKISTVSLMALALSSTANAAHHVVEFNEFRPNPSGSDPSTQTFELMGAAGSDFSGWILSIETDSTSSQGTVDRASQVSGTFDVNGLLTVDIPDLENPSFTVALVDSFTGSAGSTDIDTDNDGVADDLSTLGTVFDALGVPDSSADEDNLYGFQLGGDDLTFIGTEPVLTFRDGTSQDWYAVDFNGVVYDADGDSVDVNVFDFDPTAASFGAVNPSAVPVPAAVWLFGSALLGIAGVSRRKA